MAIKTWLARGLAGIIASIGIAAHASVTDSTDYTGLWYNASESGWGMNVIQQEQILFITLFVYGTGNTPTWYVASNVTLSSTTTAGDRTYTGALYATTGTPFGVNPFAPSSVTVAQPGNITFVGKADGTATLQYNVGTTTVNKTLTRQTWAQPNFTLNRATNYVGANAGTETCMNPTGGTTTSSTQSNIALYINSVGATMRMEISSNDAGLCTLQGNNYTQEGRYGKATLTGRCAGQPANQPNLRMEVTEAEVGNNFFSFQYALFFSPTPQTCVDRGTWVGAKKRVQ
jgi:hypothetical protein